MTRPVERRVTKLMYVPLAADTSQTTEGTVGSGVSVSVLNTSATIGEYADYANFSSLSLATAIDNTVLIGGFLTRVKLKNKANSVDTQNGQYRAKPANQRERVETKGLDSLRRI